MKLTVVCPIILISHIVQLFLIRKCYCFHNGRHIYFKYAQHNHLHCPMMGEVFLWLVLLDEKFVSAIKKIYIYIYGKKRKRKKKTTKVGEILSQSIDFREPKKFHVGALPFWGGGGLHCSLVPFPPPPPQLNQTHLGSLCSSLQTPNLISCITSCLWKGQLSFTL